MWRVPRVAPGRKQTSPSSSSERSNGIPDAKNDKSTRSRSSHTTWLPLNLADPNPNDLNRFSPAGEMTTAAACLSCAVQDVDPIMCEDEAQTVRAGSKWFLRHFPVAHEALLDY